MSRAVQSRFAGTRRFAVVRPLGAGAMGEVYEAIDRELDTRVALKVLRRHDARFLARFKQEFRAVQALEHPNLAGLGQLHEDAGRWFFTMELVDGVDFLRHVWRREHEAPLDSAETLEASEISAARPLVPHQRGVVFDEARLRDALRQLLEALRFLHGAGKIHRDVKPSNVMVGGDGRVVLLDFGLVTDAAAQRQITDEIVGTPYYMAPEQATGAVIDHGADCYALGVMLFEALTGRLPFVGSLTEILVTKQCAAAPDPRDHADRIPEDLAALCRRLLSPTATTRPTAAEALELLGGARTGWPDASLSGGRSAIFLGRDRELAALHDVVMARLAEQRPGLVLVEGQSGVGKSALIDELCAGLCLERDEVLVLAGRCYEREMTHYRAFDGVVDALVRHLRGLDDEAALAPADAGLLARMFPMFEGVRGFEVPPAASRASWTERDARNRAYAALRELLAALTRRQPVVVVIDDVQWADKDSLRLLSELVRARSAPPVAFVLASRPFPPGDERGGALRWLSEEIGAPLVHVPLAPLNDGLARELAQRLLEASGIADQRGADEIAREAAGHPLHIAELVRHASEPGRRSEARPRLDQAILERLARLPEAAQEIARVLALAGTPLRTAMVRRAADVSALDFQRGVAALRLGHLARRSGIADDELLEPHHDRVREAVAAAVEPERRRVLHGRLAAALKAAGAPPELLLRHFEGAGDSERAAQCALEAAPRAWASMAFDRAAELYRAALRLGSYDADELRELRLRLGEAFVLAGRGREAAEVFARVAQDADPDTRLRCQITAAEHLLISGYVAEGLDAIAALLDEVDTPLPRTHRRAMMALVANRTALALRGTRWTVRRASQIAPETLTRLDVYKSVAKGLAMVDPLRGADFNARYLRLALRTGEPTHLSRALGMEAIYLASQGHGARTLARVSELERLAAQLDTPYAHAWVLAARGCLAYFTGRFAEAARALLRSEELWVEARVPEGGEVSNARVFRGFSLMYGGELAQLQPLYDRWLGDAEQRGDHYLGTVLIRCCGLLRLARGELDGALEAYDRATWPTDHGFHLQHWYDAQGRGELALARGTAAAAIAGIDETLAQLRRSHLMRVQVIRAIAIWLQARLHLAAAGSSETRERASRLARRAVRQLRAEGLGYTAVWAELLLASLRGSAGDRAGAIDALRAAVAASTSDTRMYAAVAQRRLGELIGGHEGAAHAAAASNVAAELGIAELGPVTEVFAPGLGR